MPGCAQLLSQLFLLLLLLLLILSQSYTCCPALVFKERHADTGHPREVSEGGVISSMTHQPEGWRRKEVAVPQIQTFCSQVCVLSEHFTSIIFLELCHVLVTPDFCPLW